MDIAKLRKKAGRADGENGAAHGDGNASRIAQLLGLKKDPETIIRRCRQEIDGVDSAVVSLFGQRMRLVKKIGDAKGKLGTPVLDNCREEQVLAGVEARAEQEGLPRQETRELYGKIIEYFRNREGNK